MGLTSSKFGTGIHIVPVALRVAVSAEAITNTDVFRDRDACLVSGALR